MRRLVAKALLLLALLPLAARAQESHLLVITGASGGPEYAQRFHEWATKLVDAAARTNTKVAYLSEQPELGTINDKPVIKVTVDSVIYAVSANTLTVATPEMGVYVAPINVMDPLNPMATKIGTVQAVPAGTTVAPG